MEGCAAASQEVGSSVYDGALWGKSPPVRVALPGLMLGLSARFSASSATCWAGRAGLPQNRPQLAGWQALRPFSPLRATSRAAGQANFHDCLGQGFKCRGEVGLMVHCTACGGGLPCRPPRSPPSVASFLTLDGCRPRSCFQCPRHSSAGTAMRHGAPPPAPTWRDGRHMARGQRAPAAAVACGTHMCTICSGGSSMPWPSKNPLRLHI